MNLLRRSSVVIGLLFLAAAITATGGQAQQPPLELSLAEALEFARANNPNFLTSRNDVDLANWDVRQAYGAWAPSLTANSGLAWQGQGEIQLGTLTSDQLGFANQPSIYSSNYSLSLNLNFDGNTLLAPGQAKAQRVATQAQVRTAEALLVFSVTQSYLEVLRRQEGLRLAEQELERALIDLRLAQGRQAVGSGSPLDSRQAEVTVGRAQVNELRAQADLTTGRLRLLQRMGADPTRNVQLTTAFALSEPSWTNEGLYQLGLDGNPSLAALQANERAAAYGVRMARSSYFPSISLSAGVGGFTRQASTSDFAVSQAESGAQQQINQCQALNELVGRLANPLPTQDCQAFAFTEAQREAIVSGNDVFPFDFTRQPTEARMSVSIPIFQGLRRQRQVEAARIQQDDLRLRIREQELALRADIGAGLAVVRTAYQAALIEERSQEVADEQLRLAQERYRLGSASFLQLVEAETLKAQADRALVDAIFAYHDAVASLESVVGSRLRN